MQVIQTQRNFLTGKADEGRSTTIIPNNYFFIFKFFITNYKKYMKATEIIVPIKDFDGYFISDIGKVYCNLNKGNRKESDKLHEIMPRLTKNGYGRVYLRQTSTNKRKDLYIHRLVAEYFIPNPEKKKYVDHINCIRIDNRKENLRWSTAKENTSHTEEIGHVIRDKKGRYVSNFSYKEFL